MIDGSRDLCRRDGRGRRDTQPQDLMPFWSVASKRERPVLGVDARVAGWQRGRGRAKGSRCSRARLVLGLGPDGRGRGWLMLVFMSDVVQGSMRV